jgi:transcriptional regulator with XRE-family HTH domain
MTFFRAWREHRGLSVAQAAARLGLSPAQLLNLESTSSRAGPALARRLAVVYDCRPADLTGVNPRPSLFDSPPSRKEPGK